MAPNPDVTPYVQLNLYDKDPQDLYEAAQNLMLANIPDWQPREGQIEVLLLESWATIVAELIYACNRIPSAVFESLMVMYEIERDEGAQPRADIKFYVNTSMGSTVPEGTEVVLTLADGLQPVTFTTDEELDIPAGQTEGVVSATGDRYTDDANGQPVGTILEVLNSISSVDYARIATAPVEGREPETDQEYFNRGVQKFSRQVDTLVLPRHFSAAAQEEVDIEKAYTIDNYNAANDPDRNGPVGQDAGAITVAVYGNNELVSDERKEELQAKMQTQAMSNLIISVIDPVITTVNINVSVVPEAGYNSSEIVDNVTNVLTDFFDPMTWDWDNIVYRNEIISIVTNADGVDFVLNLNTPASNITLGGVANLTKIGDIIVDVQ